MGDAAPIVLFDELTAPGLVKSKPFYIGPGHIGIIRAFGFSQYVEEDNTETPKRIQSARLQMLLYKDGGLPAKLDCNMPVIDLSKYRGDLIAEEDVLMHGCQWCMSSCHNMALIDIPGSYQVVLNDDNAPGQVRMYLNVYDKEQFKWLHSTAYMGGFK